MVTARCPNYLTNQYNFGLVLKSPRSTEWGSQMRCVSLNETFTKVCIAYSNFDSTKFSKFNEAQTYCQKKL